MKKLLLLPLCLVIALTMNAQEENPFMRKNRVLVETGYNLVAGFSSGTGLSILVDEDSDSVTSLGFDGGYFLSENFALKFRLGLLSSNGSLTNFGVGGKYYIGGKVPIQLVAGALSGSGDSEFMGNFTIGYAIGLADNVALEPNLGFIVTDNGALFEFGFTFAMFL